jgi:hypothetical protein
MMKKIVLVLMLSPALLVMGALLGGLAVTVAVLGGGFDTPSGAATAPGAQGIPPAMLATYQAAATVCPGLSWTVLAAIGTVESANDQSTLPGVHSGHNSAGAEGPMQFEPATFASYGQPVPPGGASPPTPYDPVDAAYAAARLLCANGAATQAGLRSAIYAYNHSNAYVDQVLDLAGGLAGAGTSLLPSGAAAVAVRFALAQVGTPYQWGAEAPGVAFDCSGLVQAAWAAAGVQLPRVAQDQFEAGPLLAPDGPLEAGDLVFFGPEGGGVSHVGLVVDPSGEMVDAPHTGAAVRIEPFPVRVGAAWGGDVYVGATRPGLR